MQLVEPRPARPLPIRITPLIDVVFILLVFFMLTSRLLPVSLLELDNSTSGTPGASGTPLPELQVGPDGQVSWDGRTLPVAELVPALQARQITEVNLATAATTGLGQFTRILSVLDQADIETHWKRQNPGSRPHD